MLIVALNQLQARAVQWLWPGRLPLGQLTILDGDPGLGKSLVTLDLCARITTGRALPEQTASAEPASVIVINAEDSASDILHSRLTAAGADLGRVHVYERSPGEPMLRLPGDVARLDEAVAATGARLVVLDPVLAFLDRQVNPGSDPSVRAALAPLAELAERRQCAILMVRHLSKNSSKKVIYRGLYSIGFIASCRAAWLVYRHPHAEGEYVLAQSKSNLEPPQPNLAYTIGSVNGIARIAWQGQSSCTAAADFAAAPQRASAQQFLLDILKDGPKRTREIWDAAKPLPFSLRTLERARERLEIESVRVNVGTAQQAMWWLLPGQNLPADAGEIDPMVTARVELAKILREPPKATPLDSAKE